MPRHSRLIAFACLLAVGLPLFTAGCSNTEANRRRTAKTTYRDAVLAMREGEVDRALDLAATAAEQAPGFVDPHLFMGGVEEQKGNFEAARLHYRNALVIDPSFTAVGIRIGLTFVQEEEFGAAREWFQKALEADPGSFQATFNLGTLARQTGNPEEAAEWYRVAASLEPRDMDALVHLSRLRLDAGDATGALDAAEEALKRTPELEEGQDEPPVVQAAREARDAARARVDD